MSYSYYVYNRFFKRQRYDFLCNLQRFIFILDSRTFIYLEIYKKINHSFRWILRFYVWENKFILEYKLFKQRDNIVNSTEKTPEFAIEKGFSKRKNIAFYPLKFFLESVLTKQRIIFLKSRKIFAKQRKNFPKQKAQKSKQRCRWFEARIRQTNIRKKGNIF